ncbi:MAG TPA: hypothetical protein VFY37_02905 [Solirubrobacterales bacterium]|nr:hypothetical protein [Solirubrobacterales bacterium]
MFIGLLAAVGLVLAGSGEAASAPEPVSAKLLGSGTLVDDGSAAEVRVLVRCDPDPPLLEALVTGSQEGAVGFGEGFFLGLRCDGRPHVETARVQTFDEERFQLGKARFSAFVLLCDEVSSECFSGQDTRLVRLR